MRSSWLYGGFVAAIAATAAVAEIPQAPVGELTSTNEMVLSTAQDRVTRMTVDVFINGQGPFPFAVDTGAERTVISAGLARKLGLKPNRTAELHGVAGMDVVQTAPLATFRIGSKQVANIQAPVLPDAALGAAGLVGLDALSNQRVTMDFIEDQMTVRPGAYREKGDDDTIVVTARRRFGQLVLADAAIDGRRVYAIIDSGSQVTIGNMALQRLLARRRADMPAAAEIIGVTGQAISAEYGLLPEMKIGAISLGGVPIVYSDAHAFKKLGLANRPAMLIGVDLLRSFERVSVDFDTKKVRFDLRSGKTAL